ADPPLGTSSSDAELMQYRNPVGAGPSGNKWPRWEPQRPQVTSVRTMPWLVSACSSTHPSSTGCTKLGQPVPESNFASCANSCCPQAAHRNTPGVFVFQYFP